MQLQASQAKEPISSCDVVKAPAVGLQNQKVRQQVLMIPLLLEEYPMFLPMVYLIKKLRMIKELRNLMNRELIDSKINFPPQEEFLKYRKMF